MSDKTLVPESIKEGIYQDIKNYLVAPLIKPIYKRWQRHVDLISFSPLLRGYPNDIASFVGYKDWHEEDTDWKEGNGTICSATFGELNHLWANKDLFVHYEARLCRFMNRGGKNHRIFVVGKDLADPITLWPLQKTMLRHKLLGFSPRVMGVVSARDMIRGMGVVCDTIASLNGRISYFIKFPLERDPLMLRIIDEQIVKRTEHFLLFLWNKSEPFDKWYNRQKYKLPEEILKQLDMEIEAVWNASKSILR